MIATILLIIAAVMLLCSGVRDLQTRHKVSGTITIIFAGILALIGLCL